MSRVALQHFPSNFTILLGWVNNQWEWGWNFSITASFMHDTMQHENSIILCEYFSISMKLNILFLLIHQTLWPFFMNAFSDAYLCFHIMCVLREKVIGLYAGKCSFELNVNLQSISQTIGRKMWKCIQHINIEWSNHFHFKTTAHTRYANMKFYAIHKINFYACI